MINQPLCFIRFLLASLILSLVTASESSESGEREVFIWDRFGAPTGPVGAAIEMTQMMAPLLILYKAIIASKHTLILTKEICPDPDSRNQALGLFMYSAISNMALTVLYLTWSKASLKLTSIATAIQFLLIMLLFFNPEIKHADEMTSFLIYLSIFVPVYHQSLFAQPAFEAADHLFE